ncbi:flavin monoamine oxidase family protein [Portibacter lacus]|uniref:Monoamine oxidase n=1 Tax=Portibacter lacus TaxID=1099794 RepID=A0AA37SN20_9BACT|nr:NAD(P)/FAD-dependent oxidoreductase [Portibacter lacus]GLR17551.1 monoamine oxidase [Portibacter lacus]
MKKVECDIAIIGAGLTGLTLAYYLRNSGLRVKLIESRNRLGGRIYTKVSENNTPLEMGATWLGNKHTHLVKLLHELQIDTFEQEIGETAIYEASSMSPHYLAQLPPNPEPSLRISGGSCVLIDRLASHLDEEDIFLGQFVKSINLGDDYIVVKSENLEIKARKVVSTLPPNLLGSNIDIVPKLPNEAEQIAKQTHTWMGESIKIALTFKEPFWRAKGLSGTIFSNVGPIPEMYDHSNAADSKYALKGFLSGNYFNVSKEERLTIILKQLRKYYGEKVDAYEEYHELVWRKEANTFTAYEQNVLPHQNNGHHIYAQSFLGGKLFLAGSETSAEFPGYMDGAICSAQNTYERLMQDGE